MNGNGLQESGENSIPDVVIALLTDADSDGQMDDTLALRTTNAAGQYLFNNLSAGRYLLRFAPRSGYVLTAANRSLNDTIDSDVHPATGLSDTIVLADGEMNMTVDAGFYRTCSFGDRVWEDMDGDGMQDVTEPGVSDVKIVLTGTAGYGSPVSLSTTTDAAGKYLFSNLAPGTYKITVTAPFISFFSAPDLYDPECNSDIAFGNMSRDEVLTSGESNWTIDAGIIKQSSIGGTTWMDINADGIQDVGEYPLNAIQVTLTGTDGTSIPVSLTTFTNSSGQYSFSNLTPGTYRLTFAAQTSLKLTAPNRTVNDALDSDANPFTGTTNDEVIISGEQNTDYDAGYYQVASIGDFVWEDRNGNGIQEGGEPGIAGVTIVLTGTEGAGNVIGYSITTNSNGNYRFTDLVPGTYKLAYTTPTGMTVTSLDRGSNDNIDSDAQSITGFTINEVLTSGETNLSYDAGYYRPPFIGDYTWEDLNSNGIQDAGEPPLSGVNIILSGTDGVGNPVSSTTSTTASGLYVFSNLTPGTYKLNFAIPSGYQVSLQNAGADDNIDSDIHTFTGAIDGITLLSGSSNLTYDAGYYKFSSIEDRVWEDSNGNGIQNSGEPGIAGVVVTLSGTDAFGAAVSATTATDASGKYLFNDLKTGTYKITFTAPTGWVFTAANQGADTRIDSDADPTTGETIATPYSSGQDQIGYDAGLYKLAALGDYVWEDININGIQEAGESGIVNITVILSGTNGTGTTLSLTTLTNAAGLYKFSNLMPGTYKLTFTASSGYTFSGANRGTNDALDSDADPLNGTTVNEVLTSGEENIDYDAGLVRPSTIGNYAWLDLNKDGIQDAGEPGLGGVSVTLAGTLDSGSPVSATTLTDGNGYYSYSFPNVSPGTYRVTFIAPTGLTITMPNAGTDDNKDSDADPVTGMTPLFVMSAGQNNFSIDAGFYGFDSYMEGRVVNDINTDCQAGSTEQGIGGVVLRATAGNNYYQAYSQPDGSYKLYAPDGFYKMSVLTPSGISGNVCPLPDVLLYKKAVLNIPVKAVLPCPVLDVNLSTNLLRRCSTGYYSVRYCNNGADGAADVYIDVRLDSFLTFINASQPYTALGNRLYRFRADSLAPFQCDHFFIQVKVNCNAVPGQAHCTEAHIFPDTLCYLSNAHNASAKVEASARCTRDSLHFILKNTGKATMSAPLEFIVIEDGVMGAPVRNKALGAGDSLLVSVPGNGSTWRIEADQEPVWRDLYRPILSVEGCTNKSSFSTGFVRQFAHNENHPAIDLDCTANVGSYDPNDKVGLPLGFGDQHYIHPGTELEYTIRFENTGTDTAFRVVLRDTLDEQFDLLTFVPGASSHPYTVEMRDRSVLVFDFPGINLPHKTVNEAGAQGFVCYRITPKAGAPLGACLYNRAGIYFDANPPVSTNRTMHRIGVNFVPVSVWQPVRAAYRLSLAPNPLRDEVRLSLTGDLPAGPYHLSVWNANGSLISQHEGTQPVFHLEADRLPLGLIFFQVRAADGSLLGAATGMRP